jgi:sorbitol-specific phosphotransferase system component IIBC
MEKLSKCQGLEIEVSRIWEMRTEIVLVIIGVSGTIKCGLYQKLQLLPGHPSTIELQKRSLKGTAHSICKVLG